MSQIGKILLFVGMVLMILWLVSMRVLAGNLMPFVWILLGSGVACLLFAIFKDIQFFIELSGQRTTKHGMNLGVLILLVAGFMVGINYIGFRHFKTKIDYTKEGLHSLSDQTKSILKNLSDDMEVKGFFADNDQNASASHQHFKEVADLFEAQSNHVKVAYIDPMRKPEVAKAYDIKSSATVSLEYKGRKAMFEDFTEQGFTNAIIKVTREKNKIIYFVVGHGEHDLEGGEATEMNALKKYLIDSSYDVKPLNFVEKTVVPDDAAVVVVAGPKQAYFDPEIKALRDYLYKGGHLLLALDPGTKTNLGKLAHEVGVDFENNYVLDPFGQLVGGSAALVTGRVFSRSSDITKSFHGSMTLFNLASTVRQAKDKPETVNVEEIVKCGQAFTRPDLTQGKLKIDPSKEKMDVQPIVVSSVGKLKEDPEIKGGSQEFSVIVAGDSDFLTNSLIDVQSTLNHDLVLNSIASLAKDKELVSIRPKRSEGNMVTETEIQKSLVGWVLVVIFPLMMFFTGGVFWYRRRAV